MMELSLLINEETMCHLLVTQTEIDAFTFSRSVDSLNESAGSLVTAAWLLFIAFLFFGAFAWIMLSVLDAYSDTQTVYRNRKTIYTVIAAIILGSLIAAIQASIAFAAGDRSFASSFVGIYLVTIIGSAVALAFAPRGLQETFRRYVGKQLILLPRRYRPPNEPKVSAGGGFNFIVCLQPFGELDRSRCQSATIVSVRPSEHGLMHWRDVSYWDEHRHDMERREDTIGHQVYVGDPYENSSTNEWLGRPYYVRLDDTGQLVRLIRCYSFDGPCKHYALFGNYALQYQTVKADMARWSEIDRQIVQLINGWRSSGRWRA